MRSHVVVMGQPAGEVSSRDFVDGRRHLARAAYDAFDDLASRFDVVVAEGAGSPAEINLRASDYVNLGLARHAGMPTVVVGDIDRGGVFAAMLGTVALLEPDDQRLVAGFVVNKFRGDRTLLEPGLRQLEELTGRPVYGVLPWDPDLWLDSEDALDLEGRRAGSDRPALKVVVVRLPRDQQLHRRRRARARARPRRGLRQRPARGLRRRPGRAARHPRDDQRPGVAAVARPRPGRARPRRRRSAGARHLRRVPDAGAHRGRPGRRRGRGRRVGRGTGAARREHGRSRPTRCCACRPGRPWAPPRTGYEIHHGRITRGDAEEFLGGARAGSVFGTMWHGSLEGDAFRQAFLGEVARSLGGARAPSSVSFPASRERRLDLLGDLVEEHLDVDALLALATSGPPAGLRLLEPGASR